MCAVESCEREAIARGYCPKHYTRFRKHGDPLFEHPLGRRIVDNEDGTRTCGECGVAKDIEEYAKAPSCKRGRRGTCKPCLNLKEKTRDKTHRVSVTYEYKRDERFRRLYGMSLKDYDKKLSEQQGACAICHRTDGGMNRTHLVVDHNHSSGEVRGLLCHHCNSLLGHSFESSDILKEAIKYLGLWAVDGSGNQ